jgi:hypothetical protein
MVTNRAERVASRPVPLDTDHDGIPDDRDRCPTQPEDYDVFQDEDGCPDPDNDGDGFPDLDDECPYEAGPYHGCVTPCRVSVITNDDCFLVPMVRYDARGVPEPALMAAIADLVRRNPSLQGFEVLGLHAELVAQPLRERLPRTEIVEDHRDIGIERAVYVRITKQLHAEGRFSAMECTQFGPIYHPKRPENCNR